MNYFGKTKLPESSATAGYWVKGSDVYDVTTSSHIRFILENPDKFGLTDLELDQWYKKYNEPIGFEGKARNEIIKSVANQGWVRVRHYYRPQEYWSIQADSTRIREETITNFIWWALEHKLMVKDDTVILMGYADDFDKHTYDYRDGGVVKYLMKENKWRKRLEKI